MFGIEDWTVLAVTTESTGALPDGLHFGLLCFGTAGPKTRVRFLKKVNDSHVRTPLEPLAQAL